MNKGNETIRYLLTGGATTLVNYVIYIGTCGLGTHYLLSNVLAWCGAVVFAFWANRALVFHSAGRWQTEFLAFVSARLATLLLECLLLALLVQMLAAPDFFAKLMVSVVTIVANFLMCKYGVFREASHE
ncbi:MAG: GtrA family protein [Firmicutes bacterium]|nr:GtrA family protein [Bacillota bacterium]